MNTAIGTSLLIARDAEAVSQEAALRFAALACDAAEQRGRFVVALSGGSTPGPLYRLLAQEPYRSQVPWRQAYPFWTDERCVPPGAPGSNYRVAHETLIAHVPIPPENVHRVRGELAPEEAAQAYDWEIEVSFGGRSSRFDLVILGVGADGHTASLFPNSRALSETKRLAVATTACYAGRPANRVTLTLPALNAAREVLFLVTGPEKADAVLALLEDEQERLPARRVHPAAGHVTWLLDDAAALKMPDAFRERAAERATC